MNPEIDCAHCRAALPHYVAGRLSTAERANINHHLSGCADCQHELARWQVVSDIIGQQQQTITVPPLQWESLQQALSSPSHLSMSPKESKLMSDFHQDQAPVAPPTTPEPARKTGRPFLAVPILSAILLVVVLAVGVFALRAHGIPATGTQPTVTPVGTHPPSPTLTATNCTAGNTTVQLGQFTSIANIAMTSATDGWGVGQQFVTPSTIPPHTAIAHYHNCAWQSTSDTIPNATLTSLTMISPDEGWAVGATYKPNPSDPLATTFLYDQPLMLHYQGGHWQRVAEPNAITFGGGFIHMLSATEGWLWGVATPDGVTPPLYHYTNGSWTVAQIAALPGGTSVVNMYFNAPDDYWIQGRVVSANYQATSMLAHYKGGAWSSQIFPATVGITPVVFTSPTDGWAGGDQTATVGDTATTPYLAHYDGQSWQPVPLPVPTSGANQGVLAQQQNSIDDLLMFSATEIWAIEVTLIPDETFTFYHYHNGQWQVETPVASIGGIGEGLGEFARASATDGWLLGEDQRFVDAHLYYPATFFIHIVNGVWTVYARQGGQSGSYVTPTPQT